MSTTQTREGTDYFISKFWAIRYYGDAETVKQKIRNGEIKIGKPETKKGEKLSLDAKEGRWFIER